MREDLLDLLDKINDDDVDNHGSNIDQNKKCCHYDIHDDDEEDDSTNNGNKTKNIVYLLRIFSNDLVQLATASDFDYNDVDNARGGERELFDDPGVRELYRSLIVLAAKRFPMNTSLSGEQIYQLLARVLSLVQREQLLQHQQAQRCEQQQLLLYYQHYQQGQQQPLQLSGEFEVLQSLLSWLNREVTEERLKDVF